MWFTLYSHKSCCSLALYLRGLFCAFVLIDILKTKWHKVFSEAGRVLAVFLRWVVPFCYAFEIWHKCYYFFVSHIGVWSCIVVLNNAVSQNWHKKLSMSELAMQHCPGLFVPLSYFFWIWHKTRNSYWQVITKRKYGIIAMERYDDFTIKKQKNRVYSDNLQCNLIGSLFVLCGKNNGRWAILLWWAELYCLC